MCARVCTHSSCQVCQSFLFFSYFFFSLPTVPSLLPLACTDTHPCVCIRIHSLCKMLHVAIALCLCGSLLVSRPTPAQTTNAPPDLLLIILSRFECDHLQQPVGTLSSSRLKLAMSPRTGDCAGVPGTRQKKKKDPFSPPPPPPRGPHPRPQPQDQLRPLARRQQLRHRLRDDGHQVGQRVVVQHAALADHPPGGRQQEAQRGDQETEGRQGEGGGA